MTEAKTRIAFFTSGGDSPGMNATIRAIVRMAIYCGAEPFAIYEGFRGLVVGGSMIAPFNWNHVAHHIGEGGTIIKSSRCPEFYERKYRKIAALNLVTWGIDKLIVIGGDGSLAGADTLRQEWSDLLDELVKDGHIGQNLADRYRNFMVVGLAGSIDNDMVGTEITIGANSSLHRIIEAVDCIHSTASSHQRAFIIEVMGRHCGWLALNAAISCAADWLLVPEDPPMDGWEVHMCQALQQHRALGRTVTIVIISEGAVDQRNKPIKSEYVKEVMIKAGLDARVTTLGHIQRGGVPSAYDRYLGTMQGIKAVQTVLNCDPATTPSLLVGMNENRITCRPLMECVLKTQAIAKAMDELRFKDVFQLRDPDFRANYAIWQMMLKGVEDKLHNNSNSSGLTIGIINCGAPCGGMNAAVAASFFYGVSKGHKMIGIFNGFDGLINGDTRELVLNDIFGLVGRGGSMLGTNRSLPESNMASVAKKFEELQLGALMLIGGFEAYSSLLMLTKARGTYGCFNIPMVLVPATISNNVPGTEYSIGSDTALNVIVQSCDYIRQSASSSQKRVFVVDVQGGYCGYLALMSGLAASASRCYIPEEGLHLVDLQRDAAHLRDRFLEDRRQGRLIIRNEFCSSIFTAEVISKILEEEGVGIYDSRWVVLGHLQQGGPPTPLDRIRAVRLAIISMRHIESLPSMTTYPFSSGTMPIDLSYGIISPCPVHEDLEGEHSASEEETCDRLDSAVIGIKGSRVKFTSAMKLEAITDMKLRRPKSQWWMSLRKYSRILAKYKE